MATAPVTVNGLVVRHLSLADDIARRYSNRGEAHDDLVQVARIGLIKAAVRFDADRGCDFIAFAIPTIAGEIRRHFRDNAWSVKVPRRLKDMHLSLGRASGDLYQRLGRTPTPAELAAALGLSRREVMEGLAAAGCYRSLSLYAEDAGAPAIADTLGEVDFGLEHVVDREALRPLLSALPERERTVLVLRFFESLTQTEIAERVGVSQMQVSRLLNKALGRLRDTLSADRPRDTLSADRPRDTLSADRPQRFGQPGRELSA